MAHKTFHRSAHRLPEATGLRILSLVRKNAGLSRTEIAYRLGLSKASVTQPVNKLLKSGFLIELGKKSSTKNGGKRPTVLGFNPISGIIVGISIEMTSATVIVTDLDAAVADRACVEYGLDSHPDEVLNLILPLIQSLLSKHLKPHTLFLGIGIGMPGLINSHTGTVNYTHTHRGWEGINLRHIFENEFGVPVFVENNVKTMAIGEMLFGSGKGGRDQIFLWVGFGVGAGILLNGKLHRGISFSAGEIGYNKLSHLIANPESLPLLYRNQQNLGEILGDHTLVSSVKQQLALGTQSLLNPDEKITVDAIVDAAGDHMCHAALEEFGILISIAAVSLINTLNPELFIIGGKSVRSPSPVLQIVKENIRKNTLSTPAELVEVKPAMLGDDGVVLGAVGLVLSEMLDVKNSKPLKTLLHSH